MYVDETAVLINTHCFSTGLLSKRTAKSFRLSQIARPTTCLHLQIRHLESS